MPKNKFPLGFFYFLHGFVQWFVMANNGHKLYVKRWFQTSAEVPLLSWMFFGLLCVSCKTLPNPKISSSVFVKKIWIRETFPKNFTRPSVGQSIKPVLSTDGLVIQGNKTDGISAYTTSKGKKKWSFPIKGGLSGGVLLKGPYLFFGGMDGFMYALQVSTGKVLWKHYTGQTTVSVPAQKGAFLYFASPNKLYRLNAKTGESVSTYSTQTEPGKFIVEGVASPLLHDSLIYFKTNEGSLIALNQTGFEKNEAFKAFPSYKGTQKHKFSNRISLDVKNRLKWKRKLSDSHRDFTSASSGITIGPVCLYTSSLQEGLYCLHKKTGQTLWKNTIGSHGDILLSSSLLFYPSQDGRVLALDQKSGKQIWSHKVPNSIATSLSLYKDMLVYGEYAGALRFISRKTGEDLGYFPFGGGMSAPPAVSVLDSALYFISRAGWLYKIKLTRKAQAEPTLMRGTNR